MLLKTFIKLLKAYETASNNAEAYRQVGVDLFESKLKIVPYIDEMFSLLLNERYDEEGVDWIKWFVHDNKMGKRGLTAKNIDGTEICQTIEELYDYIELNNKLNKSYEFKLQNK